MNNSIVLGVDIGGSHITAALVNLKDKTLLKNTQVRRAVDAMASADEIIENWSSLMEGVFKLNPNINRRIGIAMPGPFDYVAGISLMRNQNKYDALYGLNIKKLLSIRLQMELNNIQFMNDAECFLLGEGFAGAAKDATKVIGITLGTGLGSARYCKGRSEDADLWCTPFLDGIAEDYLSTRWFVNKYYSLSGVEVRDVKELVDRQPFDPLVNTVFEEFGNNLSLFLKQFILAEQPDKVIIGGNISNAYHLFKDQLNNQLLSFSSGTMVQKTTLGEDSCLVGAASSWHNINVKAA